MKKLILVSIFASSLAAISSAADLITNGDFSQLSHGFQNGTWGQFYNGEITGWNVTAGDLHGISWAEIGDQNTYGVTGFTGNINELHSDQAESLTQTLTLAAGTYDLSFLSAVRGGTPLADNIINVSFGGNALGTVLPTLAQGNAAVLNSYVLHVATPGNYDLTFGTTPTTDGESLGAIYSNVHMSAAPVPEPSSFAAIAAGMFGVGLLRRRRS